VASWILNHASKLRRLGSKLEFFVRQEEVIDAIKRCNSSPLSSSYLLFILEISSRLCIMLRFEECSPSH
jgi:hypothetical protein